MRPAIALVDPAPSEGQGLGGRSAVSPRTRFDPDLADDLRIVRLGGG